jgi:hypothetical protein
MRLTGLYRTAVAAIVLLASVLLSSSYRGAFAEESPMSIISQASSGPLRCEIHKIDRGDAMEFRGVLAGSTAIAGHFRFSVARSGPAGTSNVNQANPFALTAGGEAQLAHVTVNRDSASHVTIEFSATAEGGITCHTEASS